MSISSTSTVINPDTSIVNSQEESNLDDNFDKNVNGINGERKISQIGRTQTTCTFQDILRRGSKPAFFTEKEDDLTKKEEYQISISQDGRYVITFDTANLRIKVFKNIDHQSFTTSKKIISQKRPKESWENNKPIAYFKIRDNLTISKIYDNPPSLKNFKSSDCSSSTDVNEVENEEEKKEKKDRWSFDISNMQKYCHKNGDRIIFISVSQIIDDDMKRPKKNSDCKLVKKEFKEKKNKINDHIKLNVSTVSVSNGNRANRTVIYCLILKKDKNGTYSLNQNYPVPCYFINVSGIFYNLAEMKLETMAKRIEKKDKHIRKHHKNTFSISKQKLQLCFTRGLQTIKLYFMENGLEIASKKFDEIEKIYSLEFISNDEKLLIIGKDLEENLKCIIWDLYNTGKVETIVLDNFLTIEDLDTRLARTSGNLLQVDDKGKVTSVLKKIEDILEQNQSKRINNNLMNYDENMNKNFKSIVDEKEPWVMNDYKRNSYCLCDDENETLQLIVGRSTVQIWHQMKNKKKDDLPNKGEPFLEYIWTNGIPIDQEREETRLRIEEFKYERNNDGLNKLNNFSLKVYWYESNENDKVKKNVNEEKKKKEMEDEDEEIDKMEEDENKEAKKNKNVERKAKLIQRKDIDDKYEEMVAYINHIIWRFIRYKPDEYRLLDVRHNVMKNLILGDCDHLIKFILFGNDDDNYKNGKKGKFIIKHIPRSMLWKKNRKFVKDDDLIPFEKEDDKSNEKDRITPTNDMELAIYHCKGRELKDTIIVAYLLEYYSQHARKNTGWMSTVSKALPLLYKYNYDDYARKLFRKECFADQDHFSSQDPYEIIPEEHLVRFILLNNPEHIETKVTSYSGAATNLLTDEKLFNVKFTTDFNPEDRNDNPFSYFMTSIEAAYFWINGNWVQRDTFSFWAVDILSLIASVFFVTILQNMLIAFMGGVYEEAATKGRQALLRYRANQIADYEALNHIHFRNQEPDPRNIYYIGQSKNFVEWYKSRKNDQGAIYKDLEEKSTFIKHTFKETDYDKVSIWKFDDNSSADKIKMEVADPKESSKSENGQEFILKEINEIKKLKENMDFIIEQLYDKLNNLNILQ
ncbi:hypothetical protein C1645_856694 [Glomus cerebriforme]|uniref:Ion transport domain-containing protein n=1 Tax=Glomus cerebriforme TaxID=658196 RepID=A0A397SJD4_9GLOM|nr:hypothetical protein C1645_856694 [Glomus cerebriforme]